MGRHQAATPLSPGGKNQSTASGIQRSYVAIIKDCTGTSDPGNYGHDVVDGEIPAFYAQPKWFAVQVALRHERKVALMLACKGCVHFLPTYKSKRRWTDRAKLIEQPLFPGYVFCQITRPLARHVLGTSGVRRIVTFGGRPYPLSDEEILVLRQLVSSGEDVQPSQYVAIGERVEITSGPFAGISGFLTHFRNQRRLVISVDLIQKSVSIEVDISSVAASRRDESGIGRDSSIFSRPGMQSATAGEVHGTH